MDIKTINLQEKFQAFSDYWNPRVIGRLNGQSVKLVRCKDDFVRHQHDNEDELFLVIEGKLLMELDNKTLEVNAGEMIIVPRKTYHRPKAIGEVKLLLFEPDNTLNTGNAKSDFTREELEDI